MRQALRLHRDSRCASVERIETEVARPHGARLTLRYLLTGDIAALRISGRRVAKRADELWRHTCFEAFVRAPSHAAYFEFNFAPSGAWAAYRFDGYRRGIADANEINSPQINVESDGHSVALDASLALDEADLPFDCPWNFGLAAVVEEAGGAKSYWALKHPPGAPDFHHDDCFALQIATEKSQ